MKNVICKEITFCNVASNFFFDNLNYIVNKSLCSVTSLKKKILITIEKSKMVFLKLRFINYRYNIVIISTNKNLIQKLVIPEIYKLAEEIGVDEVKLKTAQVYDYENGNPLIPTIDKYARYARQEDGTYTVKNELLNHCWKLWHACVITWDGMVVPCCFDKDATHRLGDLKQQSFKELWHGEAYQEFRTSLLKGRDQIDICTNCTEGCKVWA